MKKEKRRNIIIILLIVICIFNPFSLENIVNYLSDVTSADQLEVIWGDYESIDVKGNLVSDEEASRLNKSSLTGDNYQFDIEYYPYYGLLNDSERKLYKQIYANANVVSPGFVPSINISVEEVKRTFEAIYNDHPELFWLNTSYSYKYTENNRCVEIILSYNETVNDLEKHKQIFNQATSKVIQQANKYNSNYEKEKYVHDYLVDLITYDKSAKMNQSAYSALVNKSTICAGYSRAFQYILIKLSIPTYYVVGVANVNHAWNIVKLDDGYYNVDLTWDDTKNDKYKNFNQTDSNFSSTHKRTGLSLYLPKCSATRYKYVVNKTSRSNVTSNSNITSNSNGISNSNDNVISNSNVPLDSNSNEIEDSSSNITNENNEIGEENERKRHNGRIYP